MSILTGLVVALLVVGGIKIAFADIAESREK